MTDDNLIYVVNCEDKALLNMNNILNTCSKTISSIIMEPIQGEGETIILGQNFGKILEKLQINMKYY